MAATSATTVLQVVYTIEDIQGMASDAGVPIETALTRVEEWARYIESSVSEFAFEQLESVVANGQP